MNVVALVPAHNEEGQIGQTLESLQSQTRWPDRIIVVADNCTDDTVAVARAYGVEVMETVGNEHKKAGALNQALQRLLPARDVDLVLVMDADTVMSERFIERAVEDMQRDSTLGAIGGVFWAHEPRGLLQHFQANEYARYARQIDRTRRVMVLTGTAAAFRAEALLEIQSTRGDGLPGRRGDVYDRGAITEDSEITLALKTLGYRLVSPAECRVETEVMPTLRDLHRQRVRWYRGALENLRGYGLTRITARYWGQQIMLFVGVVALWLYVALTAVAAAAGALGIAPFWLAVGLVFWTERVVTARRSTKAGWALSTLFLPELIYEVFLQAAFVAAVWKIVRRRPATWEHVTPAAVGRG